MKYRDKTIIKTDHCNELFFLIIHFENQSSFKL